MRSLGTVLVLSPHTDDAELGGGGVISKLLEEGTELYWAVFSIAEDSVPDGMPKDTLKKEFLEVAKSVEIKETNLFVGNIRVRRFDEKRQDILEKLVEYRNEIQPDLVVAPSTLDQHQDHQVVARETVRAFKNYCSIIGYEMPWNMLSARLNLFVSLEERHIKMKWEMLKNYHSQIEGKKRGYFSENFIFGLARVRGVQCNSEYAEAFEVVRWIKT